MEPSSVFPVSPKLHPRPHKHGRTSSRQLLLILAVPEPRASTSPHSHCPPPQDFAPSRSPASLPLRPVNQALHSQYRPVCHTMEAGIQEAKPGTRGRAREASWASCSRALLFLHLFSDISRNALPNWEGSSADINLRHGNQHTPAGSPSNPHHTHLCSHTPLPSMPQPVSPPTTSSAFVLNTRPWKRVKQIQTQQQQLFTHLSCEMEPTTSQLLTHHESLPQPI